ncbi:MAG: TadE/TadG family type IV pilus assembly protein [Capsulimonadaceae bacterium]
MQTYKHAIVRNLSSNLAGRVATIGRQNRFMSRGAAVVELCLSLIILIPLLFATIQMSYIIDATNTISQLSYMVGRYAASHGRENVPTDEADADYDDTQEGSVLYAAYVACSNTLIPYGKGSVTGSSNSYATVNSKGATFTILYKSASSGATEATASVRSPGDSVTVTVTYNMMNHIFMSGMPGITGMISNGAANVTRICHIILIQ